MYGIWGFGTSLQGWEHWEVGAVGRRGVLGISIQLPCPHYKSMYGDPWLFLCTVRRSAETSPIIKELFARHIAGIRVQDARGGIGLDWIGLD